MEDQDRIVTMSALELSCFNRNRSHHGRKWDVGEQVIADGWDGQVLELTLRKGGVCLLDDAWRRVAYLCENGHGQMAIPVRILVETPQP